MRATIFFSPDTDGINEDFLHLVIVCSMKTVLNSDQDYTYDLENYLQPRDKEQQQKPRLLDSSLSSRYFVPSGTS